jgi:hypothetical protein
MNSVLQGADWLPRWVSGKTAMLATGGWEFQGGGRGVAGQWKLRGPMSILGGVRVFHREYRTVSAGIGVPLLHSLEVVPYATPRGSKKAAGRS